MGARARRRGQRESAVLRRGIRWGAIALLALVAGCALLFTAAAVFAQDSPQLPALQAAKVEAHQLRVENAQLRAALAQVQADLDAARLTAERAVIEAELRDTLKPPAGHVFDWSVKRFVPQEPPK